MKSYKTEITDVKQNFSENHAYFMKNKYTTENAYKEKKQAYVVVALHPHARSSAPEQVVPQVHNDKLQPG